MLDACTCFYSCTTSERQRWRARRSCPWRRAPSTRHRARPAAPRAATGWPRLAPVSKSSSSCCSSPSLMTPVFRVMTMTPKVISPMTAKDQEKLTMQTMMSPTSWNRATCNPLIRPMTFQHCSGPWTWIQLTAGQGPTPPHGVRPLWRERAVVWRTVRVTRCARTQSQSLWGMRWSAPTPALALCAVPAVMCSMQRRVFQIPTRLLLLLLLLLFPQVQTPFRLATTRPRFRTPPLEQRIERGSWTHLIYAVRRAAPARPALLLCRKSGTPVIARTCWAHRCSIFRPWSAARGTMPPWCSLEISSVPRPTGRKNPLWRTRPGCDEEGAGHGVLSAQGVVLCSGSAAAAAWLLQQSDSRVKWCIYWNGAILGVFWAGRCFCVCVHMRVGVVGGCTQAVMWSSFTWQHH